MSESCDFCGRNALEEVYEPVPSAARRSVFLCTHCALAQSLPRDDSERDSVPAGTAAWPHPRYGKCFRARHALARLNGHVNWGAALEALDVGADRGAFVDAFLERAPAAALTAVESDPLRTRSYRNRPRVTLVCERIERLKLPSAQFDLIHSCHALQRSPSARSVLSDHYRVLKPGGILYVEVPNLELIGTPDFAGEWFLDHHLFHYTPNVLLAEIKALGFTILSAPDPRDLHNASIVARKDSVPASAVRSYPREVEAVQDLMATYKVTRRRMRTALKRVAEKIERYGPEGVALWGAGYLLDALVIDGGFDVTRAAAIVDANLARSGQSVGGTPIQGPEVLEKVKPNVVIVLSRLLSEDIREEARQRLPGCTVLGYAELMGASQNGARP